MIIIGLFIITLIVLTSSVLLIKVDPLESVVEEVTGNNFSGVILIAEGEKVLNSGGYGFVSCDDSVPNTADTVFSIGSITKMFTAAAIGQLDNAGKLDIEATISDYFADVSPDKANIPSSSC